MSESFTVLAWAEFEGEIEDVLGPLEEAIRHDGGSELWAEDEAGDRVSLRFRLAADSEEQARGSTERILRAVFPDAAHGVVSVG
jgi:hypothetical protein